MSRTAASLLVASLVLLAGCAGGIAGPGASGPQTQATNDGTGSGDTGTVQFYVSDERNAIEDFRHLNVTVTKVGFKLAGSAEGDADASTTTTVVTTTANETTTAASETTTANETSAAANETATTTEREAEEDEQESEKDEQENEKSGDGEWVTRDVDSRTVDLTELQGANATLLGNMSVPAGEYEKVFVYVSSVNGTLKTGEQVNVKLPSQKLHLNSNFEVSASGSVEFVFDITVFEAGKSGKYILKPVASQSGTDVPIDAVGETKDKDTESELDVAVLGNATAGENVTVKVTRAGSPVANATVWLNGEVAATTGANGTAAVLIPSGVEEVELAATTGGESDAEAELELELGEREEPGKDDQREQGSDEAGAAAELAVALQGEFAAGEQVTVVVTDGDGDPVKNAKVAVGGEVVGRTNADGELTFTVPEDVSMSTDVTVTKDGTTVTVDASTVAAAQ